METKQPTYFTDYRSLKMTRDAQGVLVVEFHTNGGPLTFTAQDHTDFVDAFYRISQDRENKVRFRMLVLFDHPHFAGPGARPPGEPTGRLPL